MRAIQVSSLLVLVGLSVISSGCATHSTNLYIIDKQDIQVMKKGVPYAPEQDGFYLSKLYMDEVLQAKVEHIKRES